MQIMAAWPKLCIMSQKCVTSKISRKMITPRNITSWGIFQGSASKATICICLETMKAGSIFKIIATGSLKLINVPILKAKTNQIIRSVQAVKKLNNSSKAKRFWLSLWTKKWTNQSKILSNWSTIFSTQSRSFYKVVNSLIRATVSVRIHFWGKIFGGRVS
jgi:ABC-type glycerol-3-phosphate transport system permease component